MPNHKSAEKRDRQKERRRLANRMVVGRMRTAIKKARAAIEAKSPEATDLVAQAVRVIDKAVNKGVVKRNAASRYISRLTLRNNTAKAS